MHISSDTEGVLQIPEGTAFLAGQQFCSREDIRIVIVPEGVRFMEEEVFAECPNLEEVHLPEGLINIGVAAFADCPKLGRINLPKSLKSIGEGAFLGCHSLEEIDLPEGLEEIASMAFQDTGLRAVRIPASVAVIGEDAFFECENLCAADVLGENTVIETNAFGSNYHLTRGYIAPGYPKEESPPAELLYTLLWCSCPDRHSEEASARAEAFIRAEQELMMERIFKQRNIPALHTLVQRGLLSDGNVDLFLRQALDFGETEIISLLLSAKAGHHTQEEFAL